MDLADYWRGGLSLRRLSVLVKTLPPESAIVQHFSPDGNGWETGDYLLADIYGALTGQAHPARPNPKKAARQASLVAKLKAQRERLEAQTN